MFTAFLSKGYFLSPNVLREARAATELTKPLIRVHESDLSKGGASLAQIRDECPEELRHAMFGGQGDEDVTISPIVPWLRIESFQMHSLKMIAQGMLVHSVPKYAPAKKMHAHPLTSYVCAT